MPTLITERIDLLFCLHNQIAFQDLLEMPTIHKIAKKKGITSTMIFGTTSSKRWKVVSNPLFAVLALHNSNKVETLSTL